MPEISKTDICIGRGALPRGYHLKEGEGRNLRDGFQKIEEASGAATQRKPKNRRSVSITGEEMEKEGKVNECMRLYWIDSDLGEAKATSKLGDIYERGEIVEKGIGESERLRRMLETQFQKSADGLEWRISQEDRTLFIRGTGRMNNYNSNKTP